MNSTWTNKNDQSPPQDQQKKPVTTKPPSSLGLSSGLLKPTRLQNPSKLNPSSLLATTKLEVEALAKDPPPSCPVPSFTRTTRQTHGHAELSGQVALLLGPAVGGSGSWQWKVFCSKVFLGLQTLVDILFNAFEVLMILFW